jgi:hypothetical protein
MTKTNLIFFIIFHAVVFYGTYRSYIKTQTKKDKLNLIYGLLIIFSLLFGSGFYNWIFGG